MNEKIKKLQLDILRIQQGIFHQKKRLILVFEGVDAAGKGGVIRRITENLDPRGVQVHPIGVPSPDEQGKHYLYRFWMKLPSPGMISIFDRSWYGRVLVERVNKLAPKEALARAYGEINQFEKMLIDDGVRILKFCLKISKSEQKKRFFERMNDPYKQWKITKEDLENRAKWNLYKKAQDEMFEKTSQSLSPWHVIETDHKEEARLRVLEIISEELKDLSIKKKKSA
jgi:AMP-polyphosphate phosphotransferase